MAELFVARGNPVASDLALMLRDDMSEDYVIVAEPLVYGKRADVLVLGSERAYALYARDWTGEIRVQDRGDWRLRTTDGAIKPVPNPRAQAVAFAVAWRSFLKDEYPRASVPLHHVVVVTDPDISIANPGGAFPSPVVAGEVVSEYLSFETGTGTILDGDQRRELATAVCERQLARHQTASQPFVVDRSSFWGPAGRCRTTSELMSYLDRHPDSGVHHLRNGSLENWLRSQGAHHYADLAQELRGRAGDEPLVVWEMFLQRTGLVKRPTIAVTPARLFLGYTFSDQDISGQVQVLKPKGRGYLYGSAQATDAWLRVEPRTYAGATTFTVTADPRGLSLKIQPQRTGIEITSNASDKPLLVPVTLRVQPRPSIMARWIGRPLLSAALGSAMGSAFGWAVGAGAQVLPDFLVPEILRGAAANGVWAVYLGAICGVAGLVRGLLQHSAWSAAYGALRWLARTAFWVTLAVAVTWCLLAFSVRQFPALTGAWVAHLRGALLAIVASVGLLAATAGQISMERRARLTERLPASGGTFRRGFALAGTVAAMLVAAWTTQTIAWPALQRGGIQQRVQDVQGTATELGAKGESSLKGLVNRLFDAYYDSQAPMAPTPPSTTGKPAKTGGAK